MVLSGSPRRHPPRTGQEAQLAGHARISKDLIFKFTEEGTPLYTHYLCQIEIDLFRGVYKSERDYSRMWGVSRKTVKRLLSLRKQHLDDLSNHGGQEGATKGPPRGQEGATKDQPQQPLAMSEGPPEGQEGTGKGPLEGRNSRTGTTTGTRTKSQSPKTPPPDFESFLATKPGGELYDWVTKEYPQHLPRLVFHVESCFDHFAGKGERRSDWAATARNWFRRIDSFGGGAAGGDGSILPVRQQSLAMTEASRRDGAAQTARIVLGARKGGEFIDGLSEDVGGGKGEEDRGDPIDVQDLRHKGR